MSAEKAGVQARRGLLSLWHSAMAGLCFVGFWLLALAATLILLPVTLVVPGNRRLRTRHLASLGFRLLLGAIETLGIMRFRIEGEEWIGAAGGRLLVANHPCFLDVVALLARLPDANCVMKASLRRHPVFGLFIRASGYLDNGTDPQRLIESCREARERGEAVVIFPEGSRTTPGTTPHFLRGAAQIAIRAEMEILPVTVRCTPPVLTHGHPWFRMPARRAHHVICFRKPCRTEAFAPLDGLAQPLAARRLTQGLEDYFIHALTASEAMNNRKLTATDTTLAELATRDTERPRQ